MASAISHAVCGLALGSWLAPRQGARRALIAAALLAVLPDVDAVGYWLGVPTRAWLGHRGLTHSFAFALTVGGGIGWWLAKRGPAGGRALLIACCVAAMLSHGLLDAATNGGPGIAFLSPFSNRRYFYGFRPIAVSPIGVEGVLGERGLRILLSEARWILLPSVLLGAAAWRLRWRRLPAPAAAG